MVHQQQNQLMDVEKVATLTGHADSVYAVIGTHNAAEVISAGGDGMVVAWQLEMPDLGKLAIQLPASVYALAFDKVRKLLVVGHNHDGLHLVDWQDKKELKSLSFTQSQIFTLCLTENQLFAGTADGMVTAFAWPDLTLQKQWKVSDASVRRIVWHPLKQMIAIGSSDQHITLLNLESDAIQTRWHAHNGSVFGLVFSRDGRYLVSTSKDAHIKLWLIDQEEPQLVADVAAHNYAIHDIAFSPDEKYLATVSMDKSVKIWHFPSLKLLKVIDKARHAGHGTSVNAVYWTPFKDLLVTASDDRKLSVWSVNADMLKRRSAQV